MMFACILKLQKATTFNPSLSVLTKLSIVTTEAMCKLNTQTQYSEIHSTKGRKVQLYHLGASPLCPNSLNCHL